MTRRDRLDLDLKRPEFSRTGVYVLVGPGQEDPTRARVYVGEGDEIISRIKSHATGKDFWTELVTFTKSDDSLNKAHIRFIESELVKLAHAAGRAEIDNGTMPEPAAPTEAERADLESFMVDMLVILRLLGVSAFEPLQAPPTGGGAPSKYLFTVGQTAGEGYPTRDGFAVLAGSKARKAENASLSEGYRRLREQLVTEGVLDGSPDDGQVLVFASDYVFASPSAAGAVLYGGQVSGPQNWTRASDGKSLKEIEAETLADIVPVAGPLDVQPPDGTVADGV